MKKRLALAALTPVSLVLMSAIDLPLYGWLSVAAPRLAVLADFRVPSCLVCAALAWWVMRRATAEGPRMTPLAWCLALAWLMTVAILLFVVKILVPALLRPADVVALVITVVLGEEFLFRGAWQTLAEQAAPGRPVFAIGGQATVFALSHWQGHDFAWVAPAFGQMIFAFLAGLVLGILRAETGSLWPGVALHMAANALVLLR